MAPRKPRSSQKKAPLLFLTCEHAGNQVPGPYKKLFAKSQAVLETHRGWDPGALKISRELQKLSGAPFISTKLSRLIVDMNRSTTSPTLLSKWTSALDPNKKQEILTRYYHPYRQSIDAQVTKLLKKNRVAHFGIHSFSPYLDSSRRGCHIGVLFDPKSRFESEIATRLFKALEIVFPKLGIRMNFPYRGDGDGVTTDLRNKLLPEKGPENYAGLEIEFNQAFLRKLEKQNSTRSFAKLFYLALESALLDAPPESVAP